MDPRLVPAHGGLLGALALREPRVSRAPEVHGLLCSGRFRIALQYEKPEASLLPVVLVAVGEPPLLDFGIITLHRLQTYPVPLRIPFSTSAIQMGIRYLESCTKTFGNILGQSKNSSLG